MKKFAVMLAFAFAANAFAAGFNTIGTTGSTFDAKTPIGPETLPVSNDRVGIVVPFNVAGIESWDALGSPLNTVINFDIAAAAGFPSGTPMVMNGIGWDVTLEALGSSWLSELRVYFDDNVAPDNTGLFLRPGAGSNFPGVATFANPVIKLADVQIADIPLPNGILRLDFHESFDDAAGVLDGIWLSGNLLIQVVPEPASLGLIAIGALALIRRR